MRENHRDFKKENNPMYGRTLSEETKLLISKNHADVSGSKNPFYGNHMFAGKNNPMYGSTFTWMNNGTINKRVDKDKVEEYLEMGFIKGVIRKK